MLATFPKYYLNMDGEVDWDLAHSNTADKALDCTMLGTIITELNKSYCTADVAVVSSMIDVIEFFAFA